MGAWKLPDGTYTESAEVAKKAIQKRAVELVTVELMDANPTWTPKQWANALAERLDEINLAVTEAMK